ncbi:RHS repeat domain-containing protein [Megalodesulfovibrio paquesii]
MTSLSQSGELDATIGFQYDDTGELAGLTYAGETIAFTYDLDELTTKVGDFAIARDAQNGLPLAVSDGTAILSRSFNGYGEVETEALAVAGAPVGEVRLERNTIGHITRKTETISAATQIYDYEYDSMGRLTRVVDGNGTLLEAYTYGKQGERLTQYSLWFDIGNRTFAYDAEDRLLRAGDTQYEYNADGFLTKKITANATVEYTYSSRGETKTVDLGNGTVVEYRHDVLGRPAARLVNGEVTEKYLWLGRTRLLAIFDNNDNVLQRFLYAEGRMPLAMEQAGELFYLAYDQVGSLRAVTDASGNVVKNVLYDSFGRVISDSNPELKVPFGFAGGLQDSETGLVRFGYRDYDPEVGRWTSKDPIGFWSGDSALYVYCFSNPASYVDPSGLAKGHHFFPQSLMKDMSSEAKKVLKDATTGPIPADASIHRGFNELHRKYNDAVGDLFREWLQRKGIRPCEMTANDARELLELIKNSSIKEISDFLKAIEIAQYAFENSSIGAAMRADPAGTTELLYDFFNIGR